MMLICWKMPKLSILVQNNANSLAEAYIDSLRSQISTKQGAEKVSD